MIVNELDADGDSLSTRKEVHIGSKRFETPAKAVQLGKLRASETVSPLARGIVEIYAKATATALKNSRGSWTGLADRLKRQAKNSHDDEFVVPFIEYDDTADLELENAKEIAKLQTNYGDILSIPLMVPLVSAADNGDGRTSPHVSDIIQNTQVYLEAVRELEIDKPVMGVIPPISEECTLALLELYGEYGLRAYCVDFHRRSPMAQAQLDHVVHPLMNTLTDYDIYEQSLIYAVNARNNRRTTANRRSPDTVYAYPLGFDIIGDNHIAPNTPPEVFDDEGEVELRLFDPGTVSIVEVPVSNLESFLPNDVAVSVDRVQTRIAKNRNEQYRFEKIINSDLISHYVELEEEEDEDAVPILYENLTSTEYIRDSDLEKIKDLTSDIASGE